jgi:hypothetical protein
LLFEEKKGLIYGLSSNQNDAKEGQALPNEFSVVWASSFIKVPW